jgi:hypothetical protein
MAGATRRALRSRCPEHGLEPRAVACAPKPELGMPSSTGDALDQGSDAAKFVAARGIATAFKIPPPGEEPGRKSPRSWDEAWQEWQGSAFARVRSCSLDRTRTPRTSGLSERVRTGANIARIAMQKVVGSSPIIRSRSSCKSGGAVIRVVNGGRRVARFVPVAAGSGRARSPGLGRPVRSAEEGAGTKVLHTHRNRSLTAIHEWTPICAVNPPAASRHRHLQKVMPSTRGVLELGLA